MDPKDFSEGSCDFMEQVLAGREIEILDWRGSWSVVMIFLGTPVVPFFPLYFGVSLLKLNSGKKGSLIISGILENLASIRLHMTCLHVV